jgi:hypothetical protein
MTNPLNTVKTMTTRLMMPNTSATSSIFLLPIAYCFVMVLFAAVVDEAGDFAAEIGAFDNHVNKAVVKQKL